MHKIIRYLLADRARDHDSQRAESCERRPDASLFRGQSQRVHAARSLPTKGIVCLAAAHLASLLFLAFCNIRGISQRLRV